MRLEDDELVFYDFEWVVNNSVVSNDKQYVSPFFGLDISPHVREAKSFRFGIRLMNVEYDTKAVVFLYVHYLDSLGIGVTDVECFIDQQTIKLFPAFRDAQTLIFESQEIWAPDCLLDYKFSMKYRIYPTNSMFGYTMDRQILGEFGFEQFDTNFGQEMWSAARHRRQTDCEFIVNQKSFAAHRAVVTARVPTLIDWEKVDHETGCRIAIVDTDDTIFEAFLYFIYTGQIPPINPERYREFIDLASKYVRRIADDIDGADPSINEPTSAVGPSTVDISQNEGIISFIRRGISFEYNYECQFKIMEKPASQVARFHQKGSFNIVLTTLTASTEDYQCELSVSNQNPINGLKLIDVSCYQHGDKSYLTEFKEERFRGIVSLPINPRVPRDKFLPQSRELPKVSESDHYFFLSNLEFCLAEECGTWGYRLRDHLLSIHMWSVYTSKEFTDVELRMGQRSFVAHRAILSARSTVFADMFANNDHLNLVDIVIMDPVIFEDFLYFLYTGALRTTVNLSELSAVSKMFGVKTLQEISEQ